jgi:hypothetical protein
VKPCGGVVAYYRHLELSNLALPDPFRQALLDPAGVFPVRKFPAVARSRAVEVEVGRHRSIIVRARRLHNRWRLASSGLTERCRADPGDRDSLVGGGAQIQPCAKIPPTMCGSHGRQTLSQPGSEDTTKVVKRPSQTDPLIGVLILLGVGFGVLFVAALIGAGDANSQDKFQNFAYLSGLGAAPWGLLCIVTWAVAAARVRTMDH